MRRDPRYLVRAEVPGFLLPRPIGDSPGRGRRQHAWSPDEKWPAEGGPSVAPQGLDFRAGYAMT